MIASVPKNFDQVDKPHSILLHNVLEKGGEKWHIYITVKSFQKQKEKI